MCISTVAVSERYYFIPAYVCSYRTVRTVALRLVSALHTGSQSDCRLRYRLPQPALCFLSVSLLHQILGR
jgi:hypothetical protein